MSLKLLIVLSLLFSQFVEAQTEEEIFVPKNTVDRSDDHQRTHFGVDTGIISVSNENAEVLAAVFRVEAKYGFSPKWAVSMLGAQSYDVSALTSVFTSLTASGSYAVTGSHIRERSTVKLNDAIVVTQTEWIKPALIASVNVKQVFFNGSDRAVPLTGVGGHVSYYFGSNSNWAFRIGAGFDVLGNGVYSLTPFQIVGGINYWL